MNNEKKEKDNPWLEETNVKIATDYFDYADYFIVERRRTLIILISIFSSHFKKPEKLTLLDLGCGDGFLTKKISEKYPNNTFFLMDGSKTMIEKAKNNFQGENYIFIQKSFEEYLEEEADNFKYDFIYSSFATHHLDFLGKIKLYTKILRELEYKGLFLNIDVVMPTSERSKYWQLNIWKEWIKEKINISNIKDKDKKLKELLTMTEDNPKDDMPSGMIEQLNELSKIGFRDVDCFYKYSYFTVFGGTKWY